MPKKVVKPFIDKKTGETFTVVHRSQQDPKYYDEDSSKYVLLSNKAAKALPVGLGGSVVGSAVGSSYGGGEGGGGDERGSVRSGHTRQTNRSRSSRVSRMSMSSTTSSVLVRQVGRVAELSEVDASGLPLDGYDYGQHLAAGGGGMFISASGLSVVRGGSSSGASVASGRSGGRGSVISGVGGAGRGGREGGGGLLDTLSEVDEHDAASQAGGDEDNQAQLEMLAQGIDETRAVGARLGLPEDILPSALVDQLPRAEQLEAVTLRPDRMNPELAAALADLEEEEEGALDLEALEEELAAAAAQGEDGLDMFGPDDDDEEEEEGEEEGGAAGSSNAAAGGAAGPATTALRPHKARAQGYRTAGQGAWEELDDDFVAQAMGKAEIPGVQPEAQDGAEVAADAEGFDFAAHVARLMALAEGQMVDADDLDDQGQDIEGGQEDEEDGDEEEGEDDLLQAEQRVEAVGSRGGSSSRGSSNLLATMLAAYDDDNLGALDDYDPRLRAGAGADTGTGAKKSSSGRVNAAPITFKLGPSSRAAVGAGAYDTVALDEEGNAVVMQEEEEYEEYEEEEGEEEDDTASRRHAAAVLGSGDTAGHGGYVYQEGEQDEQEEGEEEEEEEEEDGSGAEADAQDKGRSMTLDQFVVRSKSASQHQQKQAASAKRQQQPLEHERKDEQEGDEGALGHMGEDERREALAASILGPDGLPVKALAFDHALAAWELEKETRELEGLQMAAKQARTRLKQQEKEERERARELAAAVHKGEVKNFYEHVQAHEAPTTAPEAAVRAMAGRISHAAATSAALAASAGFAVNLGGLGKPIAAQPAAATAPATEGSASAALPVVDAVEVPFGCAEGDLQLDPLEYFPPGWDPKVAGKGKPKWDAETILSTHTASEFRPRKLQDNMSLASKRGAVRPAMLDAAGHGRTPLSGTQHAEGGEAPVSGAASVAGSEYTSVPSGAGVIRLSRRTGLPEGLRVGPGGRLLRVRPSDQPQPAVQELQQHSAEDSRSGDDSDSDGDEGSAGLAGVPERRADETPEERRVRKAAVRAARRVAREAKKELKEAFKVEHKKVVHELRGKDNVAVGKGIIIRG